MEKINQFESLALEALEELINEAVGTESGSKTVHHEGHEIRVDGNWEAVPKLSASVWKDDALVYSWKA